MTTDAERRFTLDTGGWRLSIVTRCAEIETATRFWIDDKQAAEGKNWFDPVTLAHDDLTVKVRSTWLE